MRGGRIVFRFEVIKLDLCTVPAGNQLFQTLSILMIYSTLPNAHSISTMTRESSSKVTLSGAAENGKLPFKFGARHNNAGYNNLRKGPWRVRRHRIDFRETHRDCCRPKPGQQNARTHPSLVYLPRQPVTAETVYQSCQADARVCKCSMDSYPETRPNPTRECSATSNEADTRAIRDRDYEDRLRTLKPPSLYYRRARGDMIEAYQFTHSIYKT